MFLPLFLPFLLLPTLQATAPRVVPGQECDRACDGTPLHCVFSWTVKGQNASVGGVTREVTVVEDSQGPHLPGPPVVLCLGDFVTVELANNKDAGTSIHWHGLFQRGSQTADGVPGVTQCPQMPGTSASWTFLAEPAGTLWYHSHAEFQRDDGLSGALVVRDVRREEEDTVCDLTEHIIHLQEWFDTPAEDRYYHSKGERPRSLLVNGNGRAELSDSSLPWEVFTVRPTECTAYRFRTVSAVTSHCPITLTVPGLNITVVASDGQEIKPEVVNSLTIANGERYDFIINTPGMEERTYQILFAGSPGQFTECSGLASMAFLQHGDSFVDQTMVPDYHKAVTVPGRHLNPCPSLALPSYQSPVPLASLVATQPLLQAQLAPDRTFYLLLGDGDNGASINNVQFNMSALAAGPPLLDFQTDLSSGDFCQTPYTELGELCDPSTDSCSCFHVLQTELARGCPPGAPPRPALLRVGQRGHPRQPPHAVGQGAGGAGQHTQEPGLPSQEGQRPDIPRALHPSEGVRLQPRLLAAALPHQLRPGGGPGPSPEGWRPGRLGTRAGLPYMCLKAARREQGSGNRKHPF